MINIIDKSQCCGCTACESICTHKAIDMVPDTLGFLYPRVDISKCVDCGLCDKVCSFHALYDKSDNVTPTAYAVRHKDINEVRTSRSGAVFIALANTIIANGGVVYGCTLAEDLVARHIRVTSSVNLSVLKGSKYVQSNLSGIFKQVKSDLIDGKTVLFSGTPCQIAGLKSYVGPRYKASLYLIDLVCHGTPSPLFFNEYICYMEKKNGGKVSYFNFRDKSRCGWSGHEESMIINNMKIFSRLYTEVFYSHLMLRDSCYNCHFCNYERTGDITIADYWGWQRSDKDFNKDNNGCSLLFCNTAKGEILFRKASDDVNFIPVKIENTTQGHLLHSTSKPEGHDDFCKSFCQNGFVSTLKKYGFIGWRKKYNLIKLKTKNKLLKLYIYQWFINRFNGNNTN